LAVLTLGLMTACKKDPVTPPIGNSTSTIEPTSNQSTPPSRAAIVASPTSPVTIPAGANMEAALAQLTQVLRRFCVERRHAPQTFEELAASGYVKQIPQAPAGKKFAIDGKQMEVILIDR
jgi:hypothetical protein